MTPPPDQNSVREFEVELSCYFCPSYNIIGTGIQIECVADEELDIGRETPSPQATHRQTEGPQLELQVPNQRFAMSYR